MSSIASLQKQVRAMREQLKPEPKHWILVLEEGQEIPPDTAAKIKPGDTIIVREIPKGYLSSIERT